MPSAHDTIGRSAHDAADGCATSWACRRDQSRPSISAASCEADTGETTHAAWRSKPSFYAVSTEDRTINPDLERFMAKRMNAKTIEVKASHLSLISQPDTITKLILEPAGQT
ncbi:alpha/beta fold hydrolase [Bradyrhizobium sp. SZCCHNS2005]|uniref:alpha/beta fold hydrolase n=1 Tax=unclassified Bradyrhizobium TaxID=2631580 RepID=UPI0039647D75